jgi:hypothetical protein
MNDWSKPTRGQVFCVACMPLEHDHGIRLNDLEAVELIQKIAEVKSPREVQTFEK